MLDSAPGCGVISCKTWVHRVVFWETNGQQKDLLLSTKCKGQIHLEVIIPLRRLIMVLQVDLRLLISNF